MEHALGPGIALLARNCSTAVVLFAPHQQQPLGTLEMQILSPYPDLLGQKPWAWGPAIYVLTGPMKAKI